MEELKQMLKAIHEENKDIIFLLCIDREEQTDKNLENVSERINKRYDALFYGKGKEEKDERVEN